MIAALYVEPGGVYYDLPDVDPWGPPRDARGYEGPHPVVAHPPCSAWCQLASVNEARYGHKIGDDGGLFERALEQVRAFGGVLEHPAYSLAWKRFGIHKPLSRGGWISADFFSTDSWTCQVEQGHYGHRARKATWLYVAKLDDPPPLIWGPSSAEAWVSWGDFDKYPDVPRVTKAEAARTPIPFRDLLIEIAGSCTKVPE